MKVAIDVYYQENSAKIVAATFNEWIDPLPEQVIIKHKNPVAEYTPGAFYKRELPCLIEVLKDFDLSKIDVVIIDGYVYLDDEGKPGLGAHLYEHLKGIVPIIGVAKTSFHNNTKHVKEVCRGTSKQPLYVTAIGTGLCEAEQHIKSMYGEHRMPHILKLMDTETKR
jgi:deoxyribonuclease V